MKNKKPILKFRRKISTLIFVYAESFLTRPLSQAFVAHIKRGPAYFLGRISSIVPGNRRQETVLCTLLHCKYGEVSELRVDETELEGGFLVMTARRTLILPIRTAV